MTAWGSRRQAARLVTAAALLVLAGPAWAASITDDFNRADSATSLGTASGGYSYAPQGGSTWGITSNAAYLVATGGSNSVRAETDLASADHYAQCVIAGSVSTGGPCVRYSSTQQTFYTVRRTNSTTIDVYRCVNGGALLQTGITGASIANSTALPHTLRIEVTGTAPPTLVVKVNGATVATLTDTDAAAITTGVRVGMRASASGTGRTLDDFSAGDLGDSTAPVLSSPVGTATGSTTATIGATTDEGNGTLYGVVTTSSTAPSAAQVKAGQDHTGAAAVFAGSTAVASTGAKTIDATGLSASTAYYAHLMHEDAATNQSNVVTSAEFTTDPPAPDDPILITSGGTFSLDRDYTMDETGIVVGTGSAVTIDLAGFTLTYGNAPAPFAEDFEDEAIDGTPAGWDLGGSGAVVKANTGYLYGDQVLRVPSLAVGTTVLKSPTISLPVSGKTYAASVATSKDDGGAESTPVCEVQIRVCRASDDTVLAVSTSGGNPLTASHGGGSRASSAVCTFTASAAEDVYIRIDLVRDSGDADHVQLDHVRLTRSFVHGIVATNYDSSSFKGYTNLTAEAKAVYRDCGVVTITDSVGGGAIVQGAGKGFASDPVYAAGHYKARTVQGFSAGSKLSVTVNGDHTTAVNLNTRQLTDTGAVLVDQVAVTYPARGTDVAHREFGRAAIDVANAKSDVTVTGCTITDCPWGGISFGVTVTAIGSGYVQTVTGNTVTADTVVTNGFGIRVPLADDFLIDGNTIDGYGRGIALDVQSNTLGVALSGGTVSGNTVAVRERGNREYGPYKARALRIRNNAGPSNADAIQNVTVTGNVFRAYCGNSSAIEAEGALISLTNQNGTACTGITFSGNTYEALSEDTELNDCRGLILDDIDADTEVTWTGETIKSNVEALVLADFDGGALAGDLIDCAIVKSTTGDTTRTFVPVRAGSHTYNVSDVRLVSLSVDTGAGAADFDGSTQITYEGTGTRTVGVGWLYDVTVRQASDLAPIAGATVTIRNAANETDDSGTTDGSGVAADLIVLSDTYSKAGAAAVVATAHGPHTARASAGGYAANTADLGSVSTDGTATIDLTAGGGNPKRPGRIGIGIGIGLLRDRPPAHAIKVARELAEDQAAEERGPVGRAGITDAEQPAVQREEPQGGADHAGVAGAAEQGRGHGVHSRILSPSFGVSRFRDRPREPVRCCEAWAYQQAS